MTLTKQTQKSSDSLNRFNHQMIVILDFGSQYSELIARRIRETQVYSEIIPYHTTAAKLAALSPKGIILSGGPNSVYDQGAPHCDPEIWHLGIPILGVLNMLYTSIFRSEVASQRSDVNGSHRGSTVTPIENEIFS